MDSSANIPVHVAIIMDGNGRWAKLRGKERFEGHIEGVKSVRACIRAAVRNGVRYLTLYAFSAENWGRPAEEVGALMDIFCKSVMDETEALVSEGVRVVAIGRRDRFSERVRGHLDKIERDTAAGGKLVVVLALDYSSRDEIAAAARCIAGRVAAGELKVEEITEQTVAESLYTTGIPDPDFIIRTSGECRLSNFLLWQASYAEMYFPKTLWPDFGEEEFDAAIREFSTRERRYGKLQ